MDALLFAFVGALLGEIGDKNQLLILALAIRFNRNGAVIAGLAVAAIANAAISATAGAFIGPMLGADARLLFLALAVVFLGFGLLWRVKAPDPLDNWHIGAFLTTALGTFILGFGDGPQFLILGLAARTGQPVLAAIGGAAGVIAAGVPIVLLRGQILKIVPVRAIRITGGILLLLGGATMGFLATGLA